LPQSISMAASKRRGVSSWQIGGRARAIAEVPRDAKTELQEWAVQATGKLPVYSIVGREGPDHAPQFTVLVELPGCARPVPAFVALIGAPNAGKSTLVNQLVGAKVSIVTHKVQTTRAIVRGIAIHDNAQIVFVDTPGIFKPRRRLDRRW
jgi:hypothetical protein